MLDVPPGGANRKPLATITKLRERAERPPPCRGCGRPSWWNGWRHVFPVLLGAFGRGVARCEWPLPRAKCSACRTSFTCYPPELYPRRQYVLDVVALVVAAVVFGDRRPQPAADEVGASATSARRWTRWVSELAAPGDLCALAVRLDPETSAGAGQSTTVATDPVRTRAARVLDALEQVGTALVRRGLALVARSGLGRVLGWQHRAHGEVVGLVRPPCRLSPAMALWQEAALA